MFSWVYLSEIRLAGSSHELPAIFVRRFLYNEGLAWLAEALYGFGYQERDLLVREVAEVVARAIYMYFLPQNFLYT
ncbi:hypothetical protein KSD_61890 [Ktedonobacter sp. SOSP1-85]|nr:hypothetical protein KSD_61890 [Ktedonobacter sp. SOSP1-85]